MVGGVRVGQGCLTEVVSPTEAAGGHGLTQGENTASSLGSSGCSGPVESLWDTWGRDLWSPEAFGLDLEGKAGLQ